MNLGRILRIDNNMLYCVATRQIFTDFIQIDAKRCNIYDTLMFENLFCLNYEGHFVYVSLYLQRGPNLLPNKDGILYLTMTMLKQTYPNGVFSKQYLGKLQLLDEVIKTLDIHWKEIEDPRNFDISFPFEKAVSLWAQDMRDQYGRTGEYAFVGMRFSYPRENTTR